MASGALGVGERINGVNLGNWLVLERWMKPGIFAASGEADEIWLHRATKSAELEALLTRHRDTYITEADFRNIAAHGCNLVRIPVPYFIFGDVSGHPGCIEYLDRAFDWAERTGLKILIDLHTVPGSQNGFDNGGLTGVVRWHRSPRAVAYALDVLVRLARRYRDHAALFGIEVLNEPIDWLTYAASSSSRQAKDSFEARRSGPIPMVFLKRFYRESYRRLRPILAENQVIVFHDGFRLGRWRDWFVREGMQGVMLDTHVYLVMAEQFPLFRLIPDRWLMGWYRLFVRWNERRIRRAARYTPVIVGEWCVANNLANRNPSSRDAVYREVAAMQRKAWSASAGQIYWSYQLRGNRDFLPAIDPLRHVTARPMGPHPRLARRLDGVQPHQSAISLPKGQRHQHILAIGPHGIEILAGGAQPTQLNAVHHGEAGLQQVLDIHIFRHGPVDVERHGDRAALAVGEIIVRGVGRVERLGAQRGEHMHQRGPFVVHRHHLTPHIRDKRALLGDHCDIDRFGDPVVFLGQRQLEQSLLAARVMQHAGLNLEMPPSYTDDQIVYAARDGRIAPAQLDRMAQGMIDLINKARAAMSIDGYRFDVDAAETVQVYAAPGKAAVAAAGEAGELTKLPDNAMMRMLLNSMPINSLSTLLGEGGKKIAKFMVDEYAKLAK